MLLGSTLMISSSFSQSQLQQYNSHWPSFYFELLEHLYRGRSWNSTRPLTGMGWSIQPATMIALLPTAKQEKINSLIDTVLQSPCRKNLEKIIGILLWATSLVHHVRFLLTSLYRDLYSIPATNYSIKPTGMGVLPQPSQ